MSPLFAFLDGKSCWMVCLGLIKIEKVQTDMLYPVFVESKICMGIPRVCFAPRIVADPEKAKDFLGRYSLTTLFEKRCIGDGGIEKS